MEQENQTSAPSELDSLKARADQLGLQYHPSIGVDKLREKVKAAQEGAGEPQKPQGGEDEDTTKPAADPVAEVVPETANQRRGRLKREATKLVRVRVTCMNPAKKEWEGEIFTAGNAAIGSVKKFVPFNADDGWHVQNIILQVMRDRMCQIFTTVVDSRGNKVRKGKLVREFAIEMMDPLSTEELAELAARQAASKSID